MFLKYADAEIDSDLEIAWNTPVSKALSNISDDYELPDLKNFYLSLLTSQSPQVKGKAKKISKKIPHFKKSSYLCPINQQYRKKCPV